MRSIRRFLAAYFPALVALPHLLLLATMPLLVEPGASILPINFMLALATAACILWCASPMASQRAACFDWQAELTGLRRESIQREEMYRQMLARFEGMGGNSSVPQNPQSGQTTAPDHIG